jgi:hypothetical protein
LIHRYEWFSALNIEYTISETSSGWANAIAEETEARQSADNYMEDRINTEADERTSADASIRSEAIKTPSYNSSTGKITFTTLSGNSSTIDLIIMSMLTNVEYDSVNNEIVFDFRTHEGQTSEIRVPVGNITLPAWTTNVNTSNSEQLAVPPTTQAVKNAVNSEANSRSSADSAIMAAAVTSPQISGNDLVFKNLNNVEIGRVTLPSGGGSDGGCSCHEVPLQYVVWDNNYNTSWSPDTEDIALTKLSDGVYKANFIILSGGYCGGFPSLEINLTGIEAADLPLNSVNNAVILGAEPQDVTVLYYPNSSMTRIEFQSNAYYDFPMIYVDYTLDITNSNVKIELQEVEYSYLNHGDPLY